MKRKFSNQPTSHRISNKRFSKMYVDNQEFIGYVTLLKIDEVTEPFWVQFGEKRLCIADKGYSWLQHFPRGSHYTLTTMFDSNHQVVQYYIDIVQKHGVDEESIPWYDDLYLDIVLCPTGELDILDRDELDEALCRGMITDLDHKMACQEVEKLQELIEDQAFPLLNLVEKHLVALESV